jgi:hypothetical protein
VPANGEESKMGVRLQSKYWLGVVAITSCVFAAYSASAAFVLYDNFESYATGSTLNGQVNPSSATAWVAQPGTSVVAFNGSKGVNPQFTTTPNYNNLGSLSIPHASTSATVFWQFSTPSNQTAGTGGNNFNFVLTDSGAPPDTAGSSDVQFNWDSSQGTARVNNGGTFRNISLDGSTSFVPLANTVYNMWFVVNNNANTYQVYAQSDGDPRVAATATQLNTTVNASTFTFRKASTAALQTVNFGTGLNTPSPTFDNIYVDLGGQNLINPTVTSSPEPVSLGVFALGGIALLARRRRA